MKKVLFYIANYFVFRSGPIGYLYDICQEFPVVFLSEKLDPETEKILADKTFFPKLEKIIPFRQFTGERQNLFQKNFYLHKIAKEVLFKEKPEIIVCSSDAHSLFEMYLMRFAKRQNIIRVAVQTGNVGDNKIIEKRVDLTNAYLRFPGFMPSFARMQFVKLRKYLGHMLFYWILPLTAGEMPFIGRSSYILYKGNSGMRDSKFQTVFSKNDYEIFLKDGVPMEKLRIVPHPLATRTRKFFEKAFWQKAQKNAQKQKAIIVLLPEDKIGFRRKNNALISEQEIFAARKDIMSVIVNTMKGWTIYFKPHPDIVDVQEFLRPFESFSQQIKIVDKQEPLDKYIEISDVILELPLAAGTALFTATLQCPDKPVISVDINKEILGDYYKDAIGIEYVDNLADLSDLLSRIQSGKFLKTTEPAMIREEENTFETMAEFLKSLS